MDSKKQPGILSVLAGLCALNTLLFGVIPSVRFDSLDVAVGFFDIIQYLPVLQAVFAVACMSCVVMTAIFSFIRFIPRRVGFVTASSAFITSLTAVITLDAGVIYRSRGFGSYELLSGEKGINYGLEYNFIIVLFLLSGLVCAVLAGAAWLGYGRIQAGEDPPETRGKKSAVLRRPHRSEKNEKFTPPGDLT